MIPRRHSQHLLALGAAAQAPLAPVHVAEPRTVLGIDPGLSGAVAFYTPATGHLEIVDMPVFRLSRNGKAKSELNAIELARIVDAAIAGRSAVAFVEQVGAMPGQGVSSVFSFGRTYGTILGVLAANYLDVQLVSPTVWKRHHGIASGSGKDASRAKATALFPLQSGLFARVKDDGRAEAALIALYGATLQGDRQ